MKAIKTVSWKLTTSVRFAPKIVMSTCMLLSEARNESVFLLLMTVATQMTAVWSKNRIHTA